MIHTKIITTMMISVTVLGGTLLHNITTFAQTTHSSLEQKVQENVNIPDSNLKKEINLALNRDPDSITPITANDMASIQILNINDKGIQSLEGLQSCANLTKLVIGTGAMTIGYQASNKITDLSPLKNLTNLTDLEAGALNITDFSPIKNLPLKYNALTNATYLNDQHFFLTADENSDGSCSMKNPCVNMDGTPMEPDDTTLQGGTYDATTNTITWHDVESAFNGGVEGDKGAITGMRFMNNHPNEGYGHQGSVNIQLTVTVYDAGRFALRDLKALFKNNDLSAWELADDISQEKFNKVKTEIDQLPEGTKVVDGHTILTKAQLQVKVSKVDILLNYCHKTYSLYENNDPESSKLASGVTKATIDAAAAAGKGTEAGGTKTHLDSLIQEAYKLLSAAPSEPQWYGVVPANVAFDDKTKEVNTDVKLVQDTTAGTAYSGSKSVDVTVQSVNAYQLKDANNKTVEYKLDKDGKSGTFFDANNKPQELGTLDKTTNVINSKAHLTGTATESGKYVDTLHYVFAEK